MQTSVIDGATRARTLLATFSLMFLRAEERILIDALMQMEESNNMATAEFVGVSARTLENLMQLGQKGVQHSLDALVKMQLVHATISLVGRSAEDISRRRRKKRRQKRRLDRQQGGGGESDDDDDQARAEDGIGSDETMSSDTDDDDDDAEGEDARLKREAEEAEAKATKYAIDYRKAIKVVAVYFRKNFAFLSTVTVSLGEPDVHALTAAAAAITPRSGTTPTAAAAVASSSAIVSLHRPVATEASLAIQWRKAQTHHQKMGGSIVGGSGAGTEGTATGLLCFPCSSVVSQDQLRANARCPVCSTDLVKATVERGLDYHSYRTALGAWKKKQKQQQTNASSNAVVLPPPSSPQPPLPTLAFPSSLVPECFRLDKALVLQGLNFLALLQERFVGLQQEPVPLTVAEEVMTQPEVQKAALESHSTLALKYRPMASIPVQLPTLQEKEDAMMRRIENKIFRQSQQPPWLMSNSNARAQQKASSSFLSESAAKKHSVGHSSNNQLLRSSGTKRNRDGDEDEEPARCHHLLPKWLTADEEEDWEVVDFSSSPKK